MCGYHCRDAISLTPHGSLLIRGQEQPLLQWATWGPTGNSLVFVYDNDIFFKSDVKSNRTSRITKTGKPGLVYNGVPDWLYEGKKNIYSSFTFQRQTSQGYDACLH